jgi:hypothetical protein
MLGAQVFLKIDGALKSNFGRLVGRGITVPAQVVHLHVALPNLVAANHFEWPRATIMQTDKRHQILEEMFPGRNRLARPRGMSGHRPDYRHFELDIEASVWWQ